ncbi:MAG: acetylglutamate kinase [Candidatus Pacebacteria bacterium CG10_big_fil_rev_8_21_14_0_10_56_10]|nr:MAG: acetylglutamate kinase [Candidatus Pacebacteria bacterium CG10_big_fil_rev_8_21_14_0_10_56_10]
MIIVKVGGGTGINWNFVATDLKQLLVKEPVVLVHGAAAVRDEVAQKLATPTQTITSPSGIPSVYTDQPALDIFLMVYPGLVNKKVVATLQAHHVSAVGLSGVDGALWRAKRKANTLSQQGGKTKLLTDNLTGRVEQVNTELIQLLIANGYLPVIAPPALSFSNEVVNTDSDWAVAIMAAALQVKKVVYLFAAPGLLKDIDEPTSLVKHIEAEKIDDYLPFAQGRMKRKVLGAKKALELGVEVVYWGDGRVENPVTGALRGNGTTISRTTISGSTISGAKTKL